MGKIAENLREARALIKAGFCRGIYRTEERGHTCYCALGAIGQAVYGASYSPSKSRECEHQTQEALLLARVIEPDWEERLRRENPRFDEEDIKFEPFNIIAHFNDRVANKAAVAQMFNKAIKLAEKEGL